MKVLTGLFTAESNVYSGKLSGIEDFQLKFGEGVKKEILVNNFFKENGIEIIPTIYADGAALGMVERSAFDFIENKILEELRKYCAEIDGIFLFLHGASYVQGLEGDSGEHHIVREIRKITGPYLPICVVMDPHGNVSEELCRSCNMVTTYRNSPHTDRAESFHKAAGILVRYLKDRTAGEIHPSYVRVPIILGGERCVSADEPLASINKMLDKEEKDERILSACYHIGYTRQDNYLCCAGVTVIPSREEYADYAGKAAKKIADYAFSKRHEFHFSGTAMEPDDAIQAAFETDGLVFITDSGDNQTAGAPGNNTWLLKRLMMEKNTRDKKILIASIFDPKAEEILKNIPEGERVNISVGIDENELSAPVGMKGTVVKQGQVNSYRKTKENIGSVTAVKMDNCNITVMVSEKSISYNEIQQFEASGVNPSDYDIVAVKQGYIFPQLEAISQRSIMILTQGTTYQYTEHLPRKRCYRPIFPVDDI